MIDFLTMSKKPIHRKEWFYNRVGQHIVRNETVDLLNPLIKIETKAHAQALYLTQAEKNYTYTE